MKENRNLLQPISNVKIIDRNKLKPNGYNPNRVLKENLELLKQSILVNGWTMPIVCTSAYIIIDGYHRWIIAGEEPLKRILNGKVPIVIVEHKDEDKNIYGTITHNRARGVHLLEPMEKIIKGLLEKGKTVNEISKQLGMGKEEIWRLSELTRKDFLKMMSKDHKYSKSKIYKMLR